AKIERGRHPNSAAKKRNVKFSRNGSAKVGRISRILCYTDDFKLVIRGAIHSQMFSHRINVPKKAARHSFANDRHSGVTGCLGILLVGCCKIATIQERYMQGLEKVRSDEDHGGAHFFIRCGRIAFDCDIHPDTVAGQKPTTAKRNTANSWG